ncbi:hypothetical protein [Paraburkholderia sp. GAS42]|uniref:hypothetical protein n=1 Tax=Paraburkholderia sp. GAS42 TaxID=3035135 RepID=UPI003D24F39D
MRKHTRKIPMRKNKVKGFLSFTLPQLLAADVGSLQASVKVTTKMSEDERSELHADLLANSEQWVDATHAYEALRRATWRTKEKLAYCLFRQGDNSGALAVFSQAPAKQSPVAHCFHIYCLLDGKQWVPDDVKPQVKQILASALSEIRLAPRAAFRLLDILYGSSNDDAEQRQAWLTQAIDLYPTSPDVLSAYARLAIAHPFESLENVSNRLVANAHENTSPLFIWLAYTVAVRAGADAAEGLLDNLRRRADLENNRWLSLAAAEEQFTAGNWDAATKLYVEVERGGAEFRRYGGSERHDWEIVAYASRGRLAVALSMNDESLIHQRAIEFEKNVRRTSDEWRYAGDGIMGGSPRPFWIENEMFNYEPWFNLLPHRDRLLNSVITSESRGFLRLVWAQFERDEEGEFTADGCEQIDLASQELTHPMLGEALYEVARRRGDWLAAGKALTRFEIFRELEKEWIGDSIYMGVLEKEKKKHVRDFVKGFRDAVQHVSMQTELEAAVCFYEEVLRQPLLDHKLHEEMLQLLSDLKARAELDIGFDYALVNDLLGRHDIAKDGYWSLAPEMPETAVKNLLRIASIQRSDADMIRLEQMIAGELASVEGERRQTLESLAQSVAENRTKLSNDPVIVKKAAIAAELARYPGVVQVSHLTELPFEEALTLISLFRVCGDLQQDLSLEPYGSSETPFAPDSHDTQGVFGLMKRGLISVSPDTSDDAFDFSNGEIAYFFHRIRWLVTAETLDFIDRIEQVAASGLWPGRWFRDAPNVVLSFAMSECLTYLAHCADERKMQAPQGEKTRFTVANVLRDHSVAQAYALIWRSAANAADYLVRSGVPRAQAANSIVTRLQTMVDRGRAEGWEVKGYGRSKGCPRSQMSHVLYDVFLKVGERGFHDCLTEINLPNGNPVLLAVS